jgi:hypothetical protein
MGILGMPPSVGRTTGDVAGWEGRDGTAFVWFDASGHVTASRYTADTGLWLRAMRKKFGF